MFSHIIIFGSSLPELWGGHSLCAIICGRVLMSKNRVHRSLRQRRSSSNPVARERKTFEPFRQLTDVQRSSLSDLRIRMRVQIFFVLDRAVQLMCATRKDQRIADFDTAQSTEFRENSTPPFVRTISPLPRVSTDVCVPPVSYEPDRECVREESCSPPSDIRCIEPAHNPLRRP